MITIPADLLLAMLELLVSAQNDTGIGAETVISDCIKALAKAGITHCQYGKMIAW